MLSRKFNKSQRGRRGLAAAAGAVLIVGTFLLSSGVLAMNATGAFELDGNAVNGAAAGDDWDNVCHQAAPTQCPTGSNTNGATAVSFIVGSVLLGFGHGSDDSEVAEDSTLQEA